jgi:hypothetical protein
MLMGVAGTDLITYSGEREGKATVTHSEDIQGDGNKSYCYT